MGNILSWEKKIYPEFDVVNIKVNIKNPIENNIVIKIENISDNMYPIYPDKCIRIGKKEA